MEDSYCHEVDEVAAALNVNIENGLNDFEVSKARSRYGKNELQSEEGAPLWKVILKQFDDLLVKILLAAAVVDFIIGMSNGESMLSSLLEPCVILLILIANATVGVITERNAEQAIEELKAYEAETASVLRNGRLEVIPAVDVVPGDVVEIAVGDKVPADLRLIAIYTTMLRLDQSILTGESDSVDKTIASVPIASGCAVAQDQTCVAFSGTLVTSGRARGIVVATGSGTAIGRIRDAMSNQPEAITPLRAKLDEFGTLLSKIIAAICVIVWLLNINRFTDPALGGWFKGALYYFKTAVALAVAAIPEGLPAVVTTCLALGTRKMAKQNAIVRTLPSVETLGCTTVICTDKTGTITTNQMSVVRVAVLGSAKGETLEYEVTGNTYSPEGHVLGPSGGVMPTPADAPCLLHCALAASLCNDSSLRWCPDKSSFQRVGEATELALRVFAEKVGLPAGPAGFNPDGASDSRVSRDFGANEHWQDRYRRQAILEFSRDRKMMSVLCSGDGRSMLYCKGAPEAVLARCVSVLANNGEGVVPLTESSRAALAAMVTRYGRGALRVLALAVKQLNRTSSMLTTDDETGMTLVGLVAMHDPPRAEVRDAIATCHAAGIRVVLVTGDNQATAEAVAQRVGIMDSEDLDKGSSITGRDFDALSSNEKAHVSHHIAVFSRVEPLHKLRLVEALQEQGHVVAMTGDGVNDAPALVRADIGVAMGSGTAVARGAADMVLADDNFATIVSAVAEGRAIYNNTKQFIRYMISSNIGEVVAILIAALAGIPEVLTPVQLLWVNLVTDGLPATALGFNKPDKDIMTARPRKIQEPIVNGWLFTRYMVVGMYVGLVTAGGFLWWFLSAPTGPQITLAQLTSYTKCDPKQAEAAGYNCSIFHNSTPSSIAMTVLVIVEMFNALNNLSEDASLFTIPPWSNRWLLGAIAVSVTLHLGILHIPAAAALFGVTPLGWTEWSMILALSAPVVVLDEIMKYLSRRSIRVLNRIVSSEKEALLGVDIQSGKLK